MHCRTAILVAITATFSAGCGTFLSIDEAPPECRHVPGVAVNRRASFDLDVRTSVSGLKIRPAVVKGVDPRSVITVNTRRMPFASGKLVVKLTGAQLLKEVSIESRTGAVRAAQAADKVLETQAKVQATP